MTLIDEVQAAMARVAGEHVRPDYQADCICGEYYDIDQDESTWSTLHAAHVAAMQVRMLVEEWGLVEEVRRQTQTGFGGILIGSDMRALPQGEYSRLKFSADWHPTEAQP